MILVLCDGSISLKSSGGSVGMGSPQYGQVSISSPTGMPHVWQVRWSVSFRFTGLGLKHMVSSSLASVCGFTVRVSSMRVAFCFLNDYTNAVSFSSHDL